MLKRISFALFTLLLTCQFASSQNNSEAEQVIDDLLASVKTSAIKTDFKLSTKDKSDIITQNVSGTFILKGNKFALEMNVMKAYFDGKTQWSYFIRNNEVTITEPTERELSETNPLAIISTYRTKCKISFAKNPKSQQNHCVEMIPKKSNNDITKIEVQINKTTDNLVSIRLTNKDGGFSNLTLSNYQKDQKISENAFVFNSAKYKGIVMNDLR